MQFDFEEKKIKGIDKCFAFRLESAVYKRMNQKKQFDEQTLILLDEIKTTEKNKLRPHNTRLCSQAG